MARAGRIHGRVAGESYELVQFGQVRHVIPLADAYASERIRRAIAQNRWEPLP